MKNLQTIWGIVFLLLLFSACTKEAGYYKEDIPEGSIVMKNLTPQRVSDDMILEIVEISDTRCPIGTVCDAGGEVNIGFKAYVNGESSELSICFNEMGGQECSCLTFKGYTINVVKVMPYLFADKPIESIDSYSIEIKVEKAQ